MGAPFLGSVFCFKTIIPDSQEHPLALQDTDPTPSFGGFGLKSNLLTRSENLTISSVGLRSGHDTQLAGLAQILHLSQSFTLELAIKALYRTLNPDSNPQNTHDLSKLFNSLSKDIKARLRSTWGKTAGRSHIAQSLTLDSFLDRYSLLFETSRYLHEPRESYSINTKDFDIAIWLITAEMINRQPDKTLLYNLFSVLRQEQEA